MQIGDKYKHRAKPGVVYTITGIFRTVNVNGDAECDIEASYEDTLNAPGITQHLPKRVPEDKFLAATHPVPPIGQPSQPIQGLGGNGLDALAAAMRASFQDAIKGAPTFRAPVFEEKKPKCICGGKTAGFRDFTRQHSTWCEVYKGE